MAKPKSNPQQLLQNKINKIMKDKDKSTEKRKTQQGYEVEHIKVCKDLAKELIEYVNDKEEGLKEHLGEEVSFGGEEVTIGELIKNTKVDDIAILEDILLKEANESLESIFRNMYNMDDKTINIIGLIESYLISDLKSDLTEEYAWYFDYIRNIMTNGAKEKLLNEVKDILKKDIEEGFSKEVKAKKVRTTLISTIGDGINENQKKYGFPEVFTYDKKNKEWIFKKATAGLPDAVSINKEGKISFNAANSLTSLQMEYDQIERHGAVIALGIYNFEKEFGITLKEVINGDVENLKKKIGESIQEAFNTNKGNKAQTKLYESLNNPKNDRLKGIKKILQEKVEVTFFQTYTSKNIPRTLLESLIKSNEETSDEPYKPKDEEIKEGYREINHMTSFLLAKAQTAYNQKSENYKKELMENIVKAKNLKSQPKNSKTFKQNDDEFSEFILSKHNNDGESLKSWLDHLVRVDEDGEKELETKHPVASNLMDSMSTDDLHALLNYTDNRMAELKTAKKNLENKIKLGEIDDDIDGHIDGLKELYENAKKTGIIEKSNTNPRFQKGKLNNIKDHLGEKRKPLETLNEGKNYNTIDMSMINMLKSSDTLRTAALIGVTNVLKENALKSRDQKEIEKIMVEYEGVIEYAQKALNNYTKGDSQIIGDNLDKIKAYIGELTKLEVKEKDNVIDVQALNIEEEKLKPILVKNGLEEQFLEETGEIGLDGSPELKLIKNIKLSELKEAFKNIGIDMKEDYLKNNLPLLYEEFKNNDAIEKEQLHTTSPQEKTNKKSILQKLGFR